MRIALDIGHPAHVHYFKHVIREMAADGHEFRVTARQRDDVFPLLRAYDIPFVSRGSGGEGTLGKMLHIPVADFRVWRAVRSFRPDLFVSFASMYAAQVSSLLRKPHIAFEDTEYVTLGHPLYRPFSEVVVTPWCFRQDFGKQHVRFPGLMELAHLGPERFVPDPGVHAALGVAPGEPYAVVRLNAFKAIHDTNVSGFSPENRIRLVRELAAHVRVFVSSEFELPAELAEHALPTRPEQIHDVLHFARLLVGESGTMATEAACLGTRAIRCDSFSQTDEERGNFIELEETYGLLSSWHSSAQESALGQTLELIVRPDLQREVDAARARLLADTIETTPFMRWLIENYPESVARIRREPGFVAAEFARRESSHD